MWYQFEKWELSQAFEFKRNIRLLFHSSQTQQYILQKIIKKDKSLAYSLLATPSSQITSSRFSLRTNFLLI